MLADDWSAAEEFIKYHLRRVGYSINDYLLRDFCESLDAQVPFYIEGSAGVGKTMLANKLVEAFGFPYQRVQCDSPLPAEFVAGRWENEMQNQFVKQATTTGQLSLHEARAAQWTKEFYTFGDALSAYLFSTLIADPLIPLLLIDEVDKLTVPDMTKFLQLLEEKSLTIPKLGTIGLEAGHHTPIVIITSNNEITGPFASRCVVSSVEDFSPAEEVFVIKTVFPEVSVALLKQTVKIVHHLRRQKGFIHQPPQVRQIIRFIKALTRKQIERLDADTISRHLCHLLLRRSDRRHYLRLDPTAPDPVLPLAHVAHNARYTLDGAHKNHLTVDSIVDEAIGKFNRENLVIDESSSEDGQIKLAGGTPAESFF